MTTLCATPCFIDSFFVQYIPPRRKKITLINYSLSFKDEEVTVNSPLHPQTHAFNSFTEDYSGSPASRPASSMMSTPQRIGQLGGSSFEREPNASYQINTYLAAEGSMLASDGENLYCSLPIEDDDENKENIFPYQLPTVRCAQ